jgi:hypothetical protein
MDATPAPALGLKSICESQALWLDHQPPRVSHPSRPRRMARSVANA